MLNIQVFTFNPFGLNTYVLWNDKKEAVIIDAGNFNDAENQQLKDFIDDQGLKPQLFLLTHNHIDHILGTAFVQSEWGLIPHCHPDGMFLIDEAPVYGPSLGFTNIHISKEYKHIDEKDFLEFDGDAIGIYHTPGHVNGSLCFHFKKDKLLFSGDVLFQQSIGRTDLPTGDYDLLAQSIRKKLYVLDDETQVFPGHGPKTSIGFEKRNNPFIHI